MAQYDIDWTGVLEATTGEIAIGDALVRIPVEGTYALATTANLAAYGRTAGIALRAGDAINRSVPVLLTGMAVPSITGLGTGAQSWVRVSALGRLERCTPSGSDDVVGRCETDGALHCNFGFLTAAITNAAGGGVSPGGTDRQIQYNDAATALAGASKLYVNSAGFLTIGATVASAAQSGSIRLDTESLIKGRNAANTADLTLFHATSDGIDGLVIGASYSAGAPDPLTSYGFVQVFGTDLFEFGTTDQLNGITAQVAAGGQLGLYAAAAMSLEAPGITLFGEQTDYGGGNGVVRVNKVTTDPTTNPTDAVFLVLDKDTNYLKYKREDGTWVVLDGGGGSWAGFAATTLGSTDVQEAKAVGFDYTAFSSHCIRNERDGYTLDDGLGNYVIVSGPTISDNGITIIEATLTYTSADYQLRGWYKIRRAFDTDGIALAATEVVAHDGTTLFNHPTIELSGGDWRVVTDSNQDMPSEGDPFVTIRWAGHAESLTVIY